MSSICALMSEVAGVVWGNHFHLVVLHFCLCCNIWIPQGNESRQIKDNSKKCFFSYNQRFFVVICMEQCISTKQFHQNVKEVRLEVLSTGSLVVKGPLRVTLSGLDPPLTAVCWCSVRSVELQLVFFFPSLSPPEWVWELESSGGFLEEDKEISARRCVSKCWFVILLIFTVYKGKSISHTSYGH